MKTASVLLLVLALLALLVSAGDGTDGDDISASDSEQESSDSGEEDELGENVPIAKQDPPQPGNVPPSGLNPGLGNRYPGINSGLLPGSGISKRIPGSGISKRIPGSMNRGLGAGGIKERIPSVFNKNLESGGPIAVGGGDDIDLSEEEEDEEEDEDEEEEEEGGEQEPGKEDPMNAFKRNRVPGQHPLGTRGALGVKRPSRVDPGRRGTTAGEPGGPFGDPSRLEPGVPFGDVNRLEPGGPFGDPSRLEPGAFGDVNRSEAGGPFGDPSRLEPGVPFGDPRKPMDESQRLKYPKGPKGGPKRGNSNFPPPPPPKGPAEPQPFALVQWNKWDGVAFSIAFLRKHHVVHIPKEPKVVPSVPVVPPAPPKSDEQAGDSKASKDTSHRGLSAQGIVLAVLVTLVLLVVVLVAEIAYLKSKRLLVKGNTFCLRRLGALEQELELEHVSSDSDLELLDDFPVTSVGSIRR